MPTTSVEAYSGSLYRERDSLLTARSYSLLKRPTSNYYIRDLIEPIAFKVGGDDLMFPVLSVLPIDSVATF